MAETGTLHDAFLDELRDSYDAEKQLTKALPKLAKAATSPAAADGLRDAPEGNATAMSSASNRCSRALDEKVQRQAL